MSETPLTPLVAQILEGQMRAAHSVTNKLIDTHLDAAIDWAEAYARLFDKIEAVNDSVKIERILTDTAGRRYDVERSVEHYRAMKMGEVE